MTKKHTALGTILKKLMFNRNIRAADLARDINIPAPTIHRIVTGQTKKPRKFILGQIADYFDMNIDQLTNMIQLDQTTNESNILNTINLITWEDLDKQPENRICLSKLVVADVSSNAFALTMPDYSMEPLFRKDSILIFEPSSTIIDHSYVLVKIHLSNTYVFRQLIVDMDLLFIKALNPDLGATCTRELTTNDHIIAKLIEVRYKI